MHSYRDDEALNYAVKSGDQNLLRMYFAKALTDTDIANCIAPFSVGIRTETFLELPHVPMYAAGVFRTLADSDAVRPIEYQQRSRIKNWAFLHVHDDGCGYLEALR